MKKISAQCHLLVLCINTHDVLSRFLEEKITLSDVRLNVHIRVLFVHSTV